MSPQKAVPSSSDCGAASALADDAIRHVSDTALWVASSRAREGLRSDAAFSDPLASLLAGERGRAIARSIPRAALVEWGLIVRTSAIDRLVHEALTLGIDTVLNLGAGLDTRPYRMKLPPSLRWVEVDFSTIMDLKNTTLLGHEPICRLERIGIDLRDHAARTQILTRYGATSDKTLVITEGVLPYLSANDVATLAGEFHTFPSIRFWIQDFDNAGGRSLPRGWEAKLKAAPFLFDVKNWFEFFEKYGWRSSHAITSLEESQRINRPYPIDFPFGLLMQILPTAMRHKILSLSGAVLMRSDANAQGTRSSPTVSSAATWSFMGGHA